MSQNLKSTEQIIIYFEIKYQINGNGNFLFTEKTVNAP